MSKKITYLLLLLLPVMGFISCSDEPDDPEQDFNYDIDDDLLHGDVVYTINLSDLTDGDYILDTREPVDFFTYGTTTIEIGVEDNENYQCLIAKVKDGYKGDRLVFPAYAVGRETGDKRNVIIVAVNDLRNEEENFEEANEALAQISPLFPTYGNFLGKGTLCFEKLGNTTRDILIFSRLPLNDGNLFNYSNVNRTSLDEIHDTSFESVTKSWAFNVGLSGVAKGFTGGLNFGMHDMSRQSKDYEYFMSYLKVERTEMKLLTDEIRKMSTRDNKSAQSLVGYFATSFCEDILEECTDLFNPTRFYNDWGTDMIYQGTLGGECKLVFTREENTYQHTIGTDIKAYVSHQDKDQPNSNTGKWYNIFMQKSKEPDFKTSFDFSWQKEEYQKATHSDLKIQALGGNPSTDPNEWIKAFQNDDEYSKWSVVSYLTSKDEKENDAWFLYKMEDIATDLVNAVEKVFTQTHNMSEADKMIIANARLNIRKLEGGRLNFIDYHRVREADKTPLIIADVIMLSAGKRREKGNPKPFTAPNPANSSQYLTYYPFIVNDNYNIAQGSDNMRWRPFDSNDGVLVAASKFFSQYWYYAMAHASNDCPGLTDIQFLTPSEAHKSKYRDYHKRGDNATQGLAGLRVKDRYCYVKYYDKNKEGYDEDKGDVTQKRITAVGFWDTHDDYKERPEFTRVFASSGGTAWLPNYTGSQRETYYEKFWGSATKTLSENNFFEYGGRLPHHFKIVYTTDPLPIKDMKDLPKVPLPTY